LRELEITQAGYCPGVVRPPFSRADPSVQEIPERLHVSAGDAGAWSRHGAPVSSNEQHRMADEHLRSLLCRHGSPPFRASSPQSKRLRCSATTRRLFTLLHKPSASVTETTARYVVVWHIITPDHRGPSVNISIWIFFVLSGLAVVSKVLTKLARASTRVSLRKLQVDDLVLSIALVSP